MTLGNYLITEGVGGGMGGGVQMVGKSHPLKRVFLKTQRRKQSALLQSVDADILFLQKRKHKLDPVVSEANGEV